MTEAALPLLSGRVLVVEDDRALREMAAEFLRSEGHDVDEAGSLEQGLARVRARPYDIVLSDLMLGAGSGLELLAEIRRDGRPCEVIIMTGHGGIETAVDAIRRGADNFVTKPVSLARLSLDVRRALEARRLREDLARLRAAPPTRCEGLSGASAAMRAVFTLIERAAPSSASVLLLGESGTGKEIAARAIHARSPRKDGPFVAVNCSALPADLFESELFGHVRGAFTGAERDREGRFPAAHGGTLFLDEIGAAPARAQAGLLRALQERRIRPLGGDADVDVDVRVVGATNADLESLMADGAFRQDLYYRLAGVVIRLPPLRDRREDIPLLAAEFLERRGGGGGRAATLAPRALERLVAHDWPGNVRELEHTLERAALVAGGPVIGEKDLGLGDAAEERILTLEEVEKQHIERVLVRCAGNKLRAARLLGIPRATLYRKLERYGLEGPEPGRLAMPDEVAGVPDRPGRGADGPGAGARPVPPGTAERTRPSSRPGD